MKLAKWHIIKHFDIVFIMEEKAIRKSLFVRVFEVIIRLILKFRIPVLILIVLGTLFFAWALTSLQVDANVFSFSSIAPPNPYIETPNAPPADPPVKYVIPEDVEEFVPTEYGYAPRPEEERLHANIPDYMRTGNKPSSYPDGFVIIFSSSLLYTPEVLNLLSDVMAELESLDKVGPCLSPFDFVTVEKRGTRLALTPISPVKDGEEWTNETAAIFKERLLSDDMARNYLYSEDGNTIMLYYRTASYNQEEQDVMNAIIDPLRDYGRVAINGGSTITNRVTYFIFKDLGVLLALCFIVILFVYYLSYRSLRAVIIPSSLSIIGIIWTLGTMSLMGYKLTIVGILTPCLVLTLGSSYSVHMLSEYFTETHDPSKAVNGYARISKTIISACLTTITGFITMLVCRTEMFRQFGVSVSIGIAYCAILAILYLPTVLSLLPQPKQNKVDKIEHGKVMGTFIKFVCTTITKYWYIVIILFVILIAGYFLVRDKVTFNANYVDYMPQDDWFVQDTIFFAQTMGGTDPYYMEIVAPDNEPGFFLKSENIKKVFDFENTVMEACPDIVQSLSFPQYVGFLNKVYSGTDDIPENDGLVNFLYRTLQQMKNYIGNDVLSVLINDDASTITLAMRNYDSFEQNLQTTASALRIEDTLNYYRYMLPEGTTARIYCGASSTIVASNMIVEDQNLASTISMLLIMVIASLTLFSIFRGAVSAIPVLVGIMFNCIFMYFAGIPFDLVTIGFSSITFGAGIDDALHFLLRYKFNKDTQPGVPMENLLTKTMNETGRPIILTTVSIVAGMIALVFASFTPIKYFGLFMSVALTIAMLGTLFVLPSVMVLCSKLRCKIFHER